jgi:hypothetical protein
MERIARIHPAIGIARLGNSEAVDGHFVGPERPLDSTQPAGGYRDVSGLLKRQGARFRVFLQETDGSVRELTPDDAEIVWALEVANSKAAADRFHGVAEPNPGPRNATFTPRAQLTLAVPKTTIAGPDQSVDLVNQTKFMGFDLPVVLATAKTDSSGRLIVLGGFGKAGSPAGVPLDSPGSNFANHDGWFDDVSDGRVSASITMRDGSPSPRVVASWVVSAPPKFVPAAYPIVTMYDTLLQVAIDRGLARDPFADPAFQPSFTHHVYPILARALAVRWLWAPTNQAGAPLSIHKSMLSMPPAARDGIFAKLRTPASSPSVAGSGPGNMPRIWSDLYPDGKNGTLTPLQYRTMQAWKAGNFINDWQGPPAPDATITPDGLDRAALEPCVGAAFYPGIEASWKLRDQFAFIAPFRLDPDAIQPGDVTAQMSLPWQSDFIDCAVERGNLQQDLTWWPAQRPIHAWKTPTDPPVSWARAFDGTGDLSAEQMVRDWYRLGFLLPVGDAFLERDRKDV